MIQPRNPLGRPGSMTCSQRVPREVVARPTTGRTVGSPVIGRHARIVPIFARSVSGCENASCEVDNVASSCVGGEAHGLLALAEADPPPAVTTTAKVAVSTRTQPSTARARTRTRAADTPASQAVLTLNGPRSEHDQSYPVR